MRGGCPRRGPAIVSQFRLPKPLAGEERREARMERQRGGRLDVAWFLVCAVASSAWCVTAAKQLGATADEPPYLKMGLERWRTGSYQAFMRVGTMPLAADVQTLPLYARERWRGKPFEVEADLPKLLPWA